MSISLAIAVGLQRITEGGVNIDPTDIWWVEIMTPWWTSPMTDITTTGVPFWDTKMNAEV